MEPHLLTLERESLTLSHVLLTHHHPDHVLHAEEYRAQLGSLVCGHALTGSEWGDLDCVLGDGEELQADDLSVRALHVPGHTRGHVAFVVNEERVFTGDTLFRGSVGGTRGPGHGRFAELRESIMDKLMVLPGDWTIHPGHADDSSIARERETNPFIMAWRGECELANEEGTAFGEPATILASARDYDGGTKHWVRFGDGTEDIAPGSRVQLNS